MVGVWLSRILENSEEVESRVQTARSCTARIPIFVLRFCDEFRLKNAGSPPVCSDGNKCIDRTDGSEGAEAT